MMERNGTRYGIVSDRRGSVRQVIRLSDNATVQRLDYDAYGNVTADTNPGFQPFGFGGGLYDHIAGLVRLGGRTYHPPTGRFLQRDPAGFPDGPNRYAYVAGDPINHADFTGYALDTVSAACVRSPMLCMALSTGATASFQNAAYTYVPKKYHCLVDGVFAGADLAGLTGGLRLFKLARRATKKIQGAISRVRGKGGIGNFFARHNSKGGRVFLADGDVTQDDFAGFIEKAVDRGSSVKVLSGVHGNADGTIEPAAHFFADDVSRFGGLPGVEIRDVASLSTSQLQAIVDDAGTIVGGFCNSGVCLPKPR